MLFNKRQEQKQTEILRKNRESETRRAELIRIMSEGNIIRQGINTPFWKLICDKIEENTLPEMRDLTPEKIIGLTPLEAKMIMLINSYKDLVKGMPSQMIMNGDAAEDAYKKDYAKEDGNNV